MPGNQPTYSTEQREALIRRVLEDGSSAARATKEANAGELPGSDGPMAAFGVTAETAREWVRERREDIAAETPPSAAEWIGASNRLWTMHIRELERLERLQRTKPRDPRKVEKRDESLDRRLAAATKRHKDMAGLLTKPNMETGATEPDQPGKPRSVFDKLADLEETAPKPQPNPEPERGKEGKTESAPASVDSASDLSDDGDSVLDSISRDEMVGRVLARTRADRAELAPPADAPSTDANL